MNCKCDNSTFSTVLLTGMARAGTSFVWQILNDTNKFEILRTCCYITDRDVAFVLYRDWRDVLVSWAKLHNSTIPEIFHFKGENVGGECFQSYLINSLAYKQKYWDYPNWHFIKYEDYYPNNTQSLVKFIYSGLGCEINEDECNLLCEEFSLEKNKVVADKYEELQKKNRPKNSLPNCDKERQIHGGHITNNGQMGAWKQYVDNDEIMNIFNSLKYPLEEFGYKL